MTKEEFINKLKDKLSILNEDEVEDILKLAGEDVKEE